MQGPREYAGTLISQAGGVRYQHDRQGRITARQRVRLSRKPETWQYTWDADSRLTAVTTPDGTTWRYRYDPLGRRIAKQRLDSAGQVTEQTDFIWDGLVVAEQAMTAAGAQASQVTTWDYRPGTFTPLSQLTRQGEVDSQFYAIVTDLIGTPAELTTADGTLAGYQERTLWGGTAWHPSGAGTPLRFPGQYADDETGLHYNHHRYYDPATGQYLTPDPLGLASGANPHAYVPNPYVLADPLGLMACGPGGEGTDPARRLVVGGGRSPDMPASSGVTLNISADARPHVVGDITAAPFKDGSFDEIYFERVQYTLFEGKDPAALSEAARMLSPGGRLIILTGKKVMSSQPGVFYNLVESGFTHIGISWDEVIPKFTAIKG
jgi:RHS repeat-associated protein